MSLRNNFSMNGGLEPLAALLSSLEQDIIDPVTSGLNISQVTRWHPRMDIKETDTSVLVTVDVPGMEQRDIDIQVQGNSLVVKGSRTLRNDTTDGSYKKSERFTGEFSRKITLPEGVDTERISADYNRGVLNVTIPRAEGASIRRIPVGGSNEESQESQGTCTLDGVCKISE